MGSVIYLIRHTSVEKMEGICYGQSDVKLSEWFELEAGNVQRKLAELPYDSIISSPLSRCCHLASCLNGTVYTDRRLMEMNFGEWELLPWTEIYHRAEGKKWFGDYLHEAPPGGESFQSMIRRVSEFIGEVCTDDKVIVIVTHAGTIRAFLAAMGLVAMDQAFDIPVAYGEVIKIEDNRYNYITK